MSLQYEKKQQKPNTFQFKLQPDRRAKTGQSSPYSPYSPAEPSPLLGHYSQTGKPRGFVDNQSRTIYQRTENKTGLPDRLKIGVENLSGLDMSDVRVHLNSPKPTALQALAYTQGTDIHVAPGQERHLPHEAWHVVQQRQGRVEPTVRIKGNANVNDDVGLEKEADVMGQKMLQGLSQRYGIQQKASKDSYGSNRTIQLCIKVNGKKFSNIDNFKKSNHYKNLIKKLEYSSKTDNVDSLLKQYLSIDAEFESYEHLDDTLAYDLEEKSEVQNDFLTKAGWKRKYTGKYNKNFADTQRDVFWRNYFSKVKNGEEPLVSEDPLDIIDTELEKHKESTEQLKLYRTMDENEAKKILEEGDYSSIGKHLGDFKQSLNYFFKNGTAGKKLLEFTLKAGAHEALFNPKIMAMGPSGKTTAVIADFYQKEGIGTFPKADIGEGTLSGFIGVKSEEHGESGFSLAIGDKKSKELFEKLVDKVRVVKE